MVLSQNNFEKNHLHNHDILAGSTTSPILAVRRQDLK